MSNAVVEVSCADEILRALDKHVAGLTSPELLEHCAEAEGDEIKMGNALAELRMERKIHTTGELRHQRQVFVLGPPTKPSTAAGRASPEPEPPKERDRPVAPAPAAAPRKEKSMLTAKDLIIATLKEHGRSTLDELAKRTKLEKDTISTTLWSMKGVRRVARGTYELGKGGKAAPPQDEPQKRAKKKKSAARPVTPRASATPRTPPLNGHAQFAISETGELGIEKGDTKLKLEGEEFARLRNFIESTETVWAQ